MEKVLELDKSNPDGMLPPSAGELSDRGIEGSTPVELLEVVSENKNVLAFPENKFLAATENIELEDNERTELTDSARELAVRYNIRPEFFDDPGRSVVFASIAHRWKGLVESDNSESESTYIHDVIGLLAHEFSTDFEDLSVELKENDGGLSDEATLETYDRFTDAEITGQLTEAIVKNGLLDGVKYRLGITDDNEDPYEIRVLKIDPEGSSGIDFTAPAPDWDNLPSDRKGVLDILEDYDREQKKVNDWKKLLETNSLDLAGHLGRDQVFAPAWITRASGRTVLCMSLPLAIKILKKDGIGLRAGYDEDDYSRDMAVLEHEYTHTQGGVAVDDGIHIGINLEELRAEHYSGDKQGYDDIKYFFGDISRITGKWITDIFDQYPKGGKKEELYVDLANLAGLENLIDILVAAPKKYVKDQGNSYQRRVLQSNGHFDGAIDRLLSRSRSMGEGDVVQQRVSEFVDRVWEISEGNPDFILNYRRNQGSNVLTDLIEAGIKVKIAQRNVKQAVGS